MLAVVTGSSYTSIVYVLAALFGGGLVPVLYRAYKDWKRGPIEDDSVIQGTIRNEMGNLKDLLEEYRLQVEVNKERLGDYRQQLGTITLELAKAQARIGLLEDRLEGAQGERDQLRHELDEARAHRAALEGERDRLAAEAVQLQERVRVLESRAGLVAEPSD